MKETLVTVGRAAIAGVNGEALVAEALRGEIGRPWVAAVGKAAGAMAAGAARALGDRFRAGPVIGKEPWHARHAPPLDVAGHPLPDRRSVAAADALIAFMAARSPEERVVLLLSGGASSLIGAPLADLDLESLRRATRQLLRGGASIREINVVRRHAGRALGGRLALRCRAVIDVLALSDVIGDDPATIGSGPVSADPTTFADTLAIAERYGLPEELVAFFRRGLRGEVEETPKPGDPRLARVTYRILATPRLLGERAVAEVQRAGLQPLLDEKPATDDVSRLAEEYAARAGRLAPGSVWLAVGEPTVRVTGRGRGGRCQALALALARALDGHRIAFAALGSDGSDGPTDAAGAAVDGTTWSLAEARGLDPARALAENDAYPLFDALGCLVRTGPTGTNLLDLHLLAAY